MAVFFNGRLLVTPTAETRIDDSAMRNQNLSVGNVLALIGRSGGGKPNVPLVLRSPTHAREVLRSGELLEAAERAFAPSSETLGPAQVVALRVNPAVQASVALKDAGTADVIDLVSTDYGLYANGIKLKVESGTNLGKKLTTQFGDDYYTRDDVARDAFTVQYTGTEISAQITVNETSVVLEAPTGSTVATIDLNDFDTVQKLVDRINVVSNWTAGVVPGSANTPALKGLDALTGQDAKTVEVTVTALLQACIDWLNSVGEGYVTATRHAGAGAGPANIDWTYLSGGSDGVTTVTEWQNCFTALQAESVQWVVPLSSDPAIWAMADAHVHYLSGVGKMERRAFVGGETGLTKQAAANHASNLNSDRTAYVYPGIYEYNDDGELTLYPPYMAAALVGAAFSGLDPGEALTNKSLRIYGVETDLASPVDTDYLIQSGVLAIRRTTRGYRVVKSVSTWLNDSKYNRGEVSTGFATDFVARNTREALEVFIGQKAAPITLEQIKSRVDSVLRQLARPAPAGPAVIVGDSENPAYKNITAKIEGDVVYVEFQCSPVIPINYVLISIHAVPYSGSA